MVGSTWLLLALAGCDDTTFARPAAAVTTSGWDGVVEIFDNNCTTCHGSSGGLDLETDPCEALVGVDAEGYDALRVQPGDAESSVLFNKVADTGSFGPLMPAGGPALAQADIDRIRDWIDGGAECGGGSGDGGSGDGGSGDGGSAGYTFARVQDEVFDRSCIGCHTEGNGYGLELLLTDAYGAIVDVESPLYPGQTLVIPGDPANSFLVRKVVGDIDESTEGKAMPFQAGLLETDQITLLYGWILEGANP